LQFLIENNHLYEDILIDVPNLINTLNLENIDFDIISSEILGTQVQFVNDGDITLIRLYRNRECDEFESNDPLNNYRTPANETLLIPEIPKM